MIRQALIERILRHVYGEQPSDDSNVTKNLVNLWIQDGIGLAVKQNWKDSVQLDGVTYVNNSFYTTYKTIPIISDDEQFIYKMTLPQIPFGLGRNEAIGTLQLVSSDGMISDPAIPMSQSQWAYMRGQRRISNKILYFPEGTFCYLLSTLQLNTYTGKVRMVSGGDSTDLNSVLNVPDDYIPVIIDYCTKMLMAERMAPKDITNDGQDNTNR